MIKEILDENENKTPNSKELEVLKEHFPACFNKDGSFDIERFKGFLSDEINISDEGYELKFLGKNYARLLASLDTTTVVVPNEEHNSKEENKNSENIYISGDNLDGLKHLLKSYSGKIKCIYIDPPYNTGTDGFVYNDRFNFTSESLAEKLSISEEKAVRILDLTRRGSASHSAWLMFMYPRLVLARDLLSENGIIFISVDDNEQANLKLICDDVFGEENFIENAVVRRSINGMGDKKGFATNHEYLLCYQKSNLGTFFGLSPNQEYIDTFDKEDKYGKYKVDGILMKKGQGSRREDSPTLYFPLYYNPDNGEVFLEPDYNLKERYPKKSDGSDGRWTWGKKKIKEEAYKLYASPGGTIYIKDYLTEDRRMRIKSILNDGDYITNKATNEIKDIFGKKLFDTPKPIKLIKDVIDISTSEDDIILDFFSGSATTAHAVMELNSEESKKRQYVMIQLPEVIESGNPASLSGYETIDQIGMDRIIKAANKIKEENPDIEIDLGFKHYTLQEPSANTLDKIEKFDPNEITLFADKTLLDEFGKPTILKTWLVNDGYGLTEEAKEIDLSGYKGYYMKNHLYLIDTEIPNEAIENLVVRYETEGDFNPENVVLFGYSFTWTQVEQIKTNLKRLKGTEKNLSINFDVRY